MKPENNGLLMKENTKRVILKQKGTRMAEDGKDWNGLEMTILKILANLFFSKYANGDIAPLNYTDISNAWGLLKNFFYGEASNPYPFILISFFVRRGTPFHVPLIKNGTTFKLNTYTRRVTTCLFLIFPLIAPQNT